MVNVMRWMRQRQKQLLATLVVLIMVTWTIGGAIERLMRPSQHRGGEIFGERVSGDEYARLIGPLTIVMPQAARERNTPAYAWETLLMNREAERMGIETGDAEIVAWRLRNFVDEQGNYMPESYRQMLQYYGLSPREFEDGLRLWLTSRKVTDSVRESVDMTAEEAWLWWASDNREVRIEYAFLGAAELEPYVELTEDDIRGQYESGKDLFASDAPNQAGYLQPERIRMEYILVPFEPLEKLAVITERQVAGYYEENKERYRLYTAAEIENQDGEEKAPRYRALDEVADDIEKTLRKAEAKRVAEEMRENLMTEVDKARYAPFGATEVPRADLKEIAEGMDVRHRTTEWFTADTAADEIPGANRLARQVFGKGLANLYLPRADVDAEDGLLIYQVTAVELPRPAPLPEIRDRVVQDAKRQKALEEAVRIVSTAVEDKETLDAVVDEIEKLVAEKVSATVSEESPEVSGEPKAGAETERQAEPGKDPIVREEGNPVRNEAGDPGEAPAAQGGNDDKPAVREDPVQTGEAGAEEGPGKEEEAAEGETAEDAIEESEKKGPVARATSGYFGRPYMWQDPRTNRSVPIRSDTGVPGGNRGYLAHEAFRLRKGQIGFCYEPEGEPIGAYALVLLDTKRPDRADFERQAVQLYPRILMEKTEAALQAWRADVLRRARPSNDVQAALVQLPEWQAAIAGQ